MDVYHGSNFLAVLSITTSSICIVWVKLYLSAQSVYHGTLDRVHIIARISIVAPDITANLKYSIGHLTLYRLFYKHKPCREEGWVVVSLMSQNFVFQVFHTHFRQLKHNPRFWTCKCAWWDSWSSTYRIGCKLLGLLEMAEVHGNRTHPPALHRCTGFEDQKQ